MADILISMWDFQRPEVNSGIFSLSREAVFLPKDTGREDALLDREGSFD